jgi:hypothetical protein
MSPPRQVPGCPRHPAIASRKCPDVRCMRTWKPAGAPTAAEQLARWVAGESVCPNEHHECCPDFSCCRPELQWPAARRQQYMAASRGEREKLMMSGLGALLSDAEVKAYVTRGEPKDHG